MYKVTLRKYTEPPKGLFSAVRQIIKGTEDKIEIHDSVPNKAFHYDTLKIALDEYPNRAKEYFNQFNQILAH